MEGVYKILGDSEDGVYGNISDEEFEKILNENVNKEEQSIEAYDNAKFEEGTKENISDLQNNVVNEEIVYVKKPSILQELWDSISDQAKSTIKALAIGTAIYLFYELFDQKESQKENKLDKLESVLQELENIEKGNTEEYDENDEDDEYDEDDDENEIDENEEGEPESEEVEQ